MNRRTLALITMLAAVLFAGACAGPNKLARQSHEALAKGDLHKAYEKALKAVQKDPQNAAARAAYTEASARVADDYIARVRAQAAADTVRAADLALDFRDFRASVAAHGSPLPSNPAYEDDEDMILASAARTMDRHGRAAMADRRPKEAWHDFARALAYVPDDTAIAKRQSDAWRAAHARVALLPFEDGVSVRGLSQEIADEMDERVGAKVGELTFTDFVDGQSVDQVMTVAQAGHLGREDALALGRKLGADRVVTGRFAGMRSNNDFKDMTIPIYRKVESKNDAGEKIVRWVESSLHVVTREREVTVNWEYSVLDVKTGAVLMQRTKPAVAAACIVWTDYRPEGDCDLYALLPPDVRKNDSARAKRVDDQWQERVGTWTLPTLLVKARDERNRSKWSNNYRREFHGVESRRHPVWLGELPAESDLAFVALDDAWRDVFAGLKELDARD